MSEPRGAVGGLAEDDVQSLILGYLHWRAHQEGQHAGAVVEERAVRTRDRLVDHLLARGGQRAAVVASARIFDVTVAGCGAVAPIGPRAAAGGEWCVAFTFTWGPTGQIACDIGGAFRAVVLVVVLYGGSIVLTPTDPGGTGLPPTTWNLESQVEVLAEAP